MAGLTEPQAKEEYGEDNVIGRYARFPSMLYAFNEPENKVKTGPVTHTLTWFVRPMFCMALNILT